MEKTQNIDNFLSKLVEGSTSIISSPKTIVDLQRMGVKFQESTQKTDDQYLDELFSMRRTAANSLIYKFPKAPQVSIPTIGLLYDEIRECILFGLFGAAISLSAVLLEYSLKYAIVKKTSGDKYDKAEWDRIENMEFGPCIIEAKHLGIINETQVIELRRFKDKVRNPYLHYNIKKLTKKVIAKKVKKVNVISQKVELLNIRVSDDPIFWSHAKKFVDKHNVFEIFVFVDRKVKELLEAK